MPKKRKPAHQMTSDEIAKHVFPPEVQKHLKKVASEAEKKSDLSSSDRP